MATYRVNRRSFLRSLAAQSAIVAASSSRAAASGVYTVGVGNSSDSYEATQTAIAASGQFPSVAGQTVIIKPNLVIGQPCTTGITTDPQVVRAIVDLALAGGATGIVIAEGSCAAGGAPFGPCGYEFFTSYANPPSLIQLVDLTTQSVTLVKVSKSGGLAYQEMWLPVILTEPNTVFISAGKLKTHYSVGASLSTKNIVGTAPPKKYQVSIASERQDLHYRGINESINDLIRVRPIQFAVIDGVWGMEGQGPTAGTAVPANLVFAGLNSIAVDLVALQAIEISAATVPYMTYAANLKLGPSSTSSITVTGDPFTPIAFTPATTPPIVWRPVPSPNSISQGQQTTISYNIPQACYAQVQIIQDSDVHPGITVVKMLQPFTSQAAGTYSVIWDGTDSSGSLVAPGPYLVQVQTEYVIDAVSTAVNYASALIGVTS
jgi:uncharacterized protein (DUF362 family)